VSGRVILASNSASRSAILTGAGVAFDTMSPGVDEDVVKRGLQAQGDGPREVAVALADSKALAVSRVQHGLVIGADQTLEYAGGLYDKVDSIDAARARLRLLRGRTHNLHAGVAVARNGDVIWRDLVTTTLVMRDFSDSFLEGYLATEGPLALGSVGCYRLEGPGAQLFERIDGDYFAILGLPLLSLMDLLRREGALPS
jgi:septum formation protein